MLRNNLIWKQSNFANNNSTELFPNASENTAVLLKWKSTEWKITSINKSSRLHFYIFTFSSTFLRPKHTQDHERPQRNEWTWIPCFIKTRETCECVDISWVCVHLKVLWQTCSPSSTSVKDCLTSSAETRIRRVGLSPWHQTNNLKFWKRSQHWRRLGFEGFPEASAWRNRTETTKTAWGWTKYLLNWR